MSVEDFWLRLYGLTSDLDPVSDVNWNHTIDELVAEYHHFPSPTREALRGHLAVLISRLTHLHSRLA